MAEIPEGNERAAEGQAQDQESPGHAMAIGYYIAAVVLIFGTILVLYGILGPESQTQRSLGVNINLWWGLFMVAFGCVVLGMSWASPRRRAARRAAR